MKTFLNFRIVVNLARTFHETQSFFIVSNKKKSFSAYEEQYGGKGSCLSSQAIPNRIYLL